MATTTNGAKRVKIPEPKLVPEKVEPWPDPYRQRQGLACWMVIGVFGGVRYAYDTGEVWHRKAEADGLAQELAGKEVRLSKLFYEPRLQAQQ